MTKEVKVAWGHVHLVWRVIKKFPFELQNCHPEYTLYEDWYRRARAVVLFCLARLVGESSVQVSTELRSMVSPGL